jgi:hypothetical protein
MHSDQPYTLKCGKLYYDPTQNPSRDRIRQGVWASDKIMCSCELYETVP